MSYPKTKDEWWSMLTERKDQVRTLVVDWHPRSGEYDNAHGMKITAAAAEELCDAARAAMAGEGPINAGLCFDTLLAARDPDLAALLSGAWWGLPESAEVRSLPGFMLLCDLCSEAHVLYEGGELPESLS